jgi:hypothetical protein
VEILAAFADSHCWITELDGPLSRRHAGGYPIGLQSRVASIRGQIVSGREVLRMPLMTWTEEMSVKVKVLDDDH